jgi:SAM-dependent methyltransferase
MAAKVLKRVGQVRRLGARGLVRTAYVRALGPSVYRLTEPARTMSAARHRQRSLNHLLEVRLERLKERAQRETVGQCGAGVQLDFAGEVSRFVQTLEALLDLAAAACSVPKVSAVDWEACSITLQPIDGVTFRERPRHDEREAALAAIEETLTAIHRAGYAVGDIDANSLVFPRDGTRPVMLDLRDAVPLGGLSRDLSIHLRDTDRRMFNRLFGTRLLTADKLRNLLSPSAGIPRDRISGMAEVYAPVVLRDDIRWGKIWNTDLGIGRWNFIMKEHLPIPIGGSVLDLGSNNGFNPLQMLRAGAASAVGVEIDAQAIEQAKFLKSAFEWLDNRSYDFRCIHGSQGDLQFFDLPRFDMVTAFCSLYYLPEAQIRDLVRYIRTRTDVLVLQCNTDRLIDRGGSEETFRKASLEFAVEMLDQAGFSNLQVIAPAGYSRPLVIGRS